MKNKPKPMYLYENGMYYINHENEHDSFLWNSSEEKGEFVGEIIHVKTRESSYNDRQ